MRKTSLALSAATLTLALTSCSAPPPAAPAIDAAAEAAKLKAEEVAWSQQMTSRDVDKQLAHYTDDAAVMATGMPAAKGSAEIRKMMTEMFADPNMKLEFTPEVAEVSKSGDLAFTRGSYTMTMSDPKTKKPVTDKGVYVTVYKKAADGSWKAVEDIASSSGAH